MKQNSSIMFHSIPNTLIKNYFRDVAKAVIVVPLLLLLCLFSAGCDTPEGANLAASFLPRINVRGPGFAGSYGVPAEVLESPRLKFQEAVLKGDLRRAERYADERYIDERIKGFPPVYYASISGDTEMIEMLRQHGASLSFHQNGHSLAYFAASCGHVQTGETLMEMGGGNHSDIATGRVAFAEDSRRQREQANATAAVALAFIAAMANSSPSNSDSSNDTGAALHSQADMQRQEGVDPHSEY